MRKIQNIFDWTFLKFVLIGVVNTLFGTAVMFLFYNLLGFSYWVSSASNYVFGSILSFFLNKHVTFQNRDKSPKVVLKFILNITVCYLVAYGAAKPLAMWCLSGAPQTVQENIAMLVGMGLFVLLNYFGQRFFAFRADASKSDASPALEEKEPKKNP